MLLFSLCGSVGRQDSHKLASSILLVYSSESLGRNRSCFELETRDKGDKSLLLV